MTALSWTLRAYVVAVIGAALGSVAFAGIPVATGSEEGLLRTGEVATAVLLFVLAWLAQRHPVHLGPKLKVTVEEAATFAGALVLSPLLAMLVAGTSSVLGVRFNGEIPLYNRLFNAASSLLSTGAAALAFGALRGSERIGDNAAALAAAAVVGYLVRTELVDGAIALQLRRSLFAAWWLDHRRDLAQLGSLYAMGSVAAMVAQAEPWALVLFSAPVMLILTSFRETVRLREQTREAILRVADLIDARDAYTFGHSIRVAECAERVARRMGMADAQVELIREAARLHDVGKISTDDRILQKPGRLDRDEMEEMRRHCEHGYGFLKQLPEFWEGAELVRLHHERYDGAGYPRGLAGDALPREASIIAVADAWDAMTSDRPYRRALGYDEARDELARHRGTQWDPAVVDVFAAMLDEERAVVARAIPATAAN